MLRLPPRFLPPHLPSILAAALTLLATGHSAARQPSQNLPPLRSIDSRYYTVHTDLDNDLAADLTQRLDAMYEEYINRFKEFTPTTTTRLNAYLLDRHSTYLRVTDRRLENSAGVFIPDRNLLAAYLQNQGRDEIRRVLQHEAFHQFAHNAISPDLPIWLNEGIAELFEAGIWTGNAFLLNQVPPYRVRQLQADLAAARLEPLSRLFDISHEQWFNTIRQDPDRAGTLYNQSWAVVHWLINSDSDARRTSNTRRISNRDRLVSYLRSRRNGTPHTQAWTQAFPQSPQAMQRGFEDWIKQLQPTPEAALIERQQVLADMLVGFHNAGQSPPNIDDFKKLATQSAVRLTYTRGSVRWTTDHDPTTYFKNQNGKFWSDRELRFVQPKSATAKAKTRTPSTPLPPDIFLQVRRDLAVRTHFYVLDGDIRSETQIEPTK